MSAYDPMYGPAARCKKIRRAGGERSCINVSGLYLERAPGHHGYQRACKLITGKASTGPFGSPAFACAGKTEPPSRLILSQTSAGNWTSCECSRGLKPRFKNHLGRAQVCDRNGLENGFANRHGGLLGVASVLGGRDCLRGLRRTVASLSAVLRGWY
jgi:hypothetical protein